MKYFYNKETNKLLGFDDSATPFVIQFDEIAAREGSLMGFPVFSGPLPEATKKSTGGGKPAKKPGSVLRERAVAFQKKKSTEAESEDEKKATRDLIEVRINEGMKAQQIADETGVTVQTVYNVKNKMKAEGRLEEKKVISKEMEDEIVEMAKDLKNAIEISAELDLPLVDVQRIIKANL